MYYCLILSLLSLLYLVRQSGGNDIFHVNSRVTFYPDSFSEYFGYTVLLTNSSLIIGAPKAKSRVNGTISPGLVFTCQLTTLDKGNVTCHPLGMDDDGHDKSVRRVVSKDFFRHDMWFGATVGSLPAGKLFACAPRWADPYKDKHLLANGACYVETKKRGLGLTPLKDQRRLAFLTDGKRKVYGEYGTHLNFYAYGQAGMSMKVTEMESIIIGAPGLMQWTGGIIDYRFSPDANSVFFSKMPISNPYYTTELGPDDYFGYSVESGIFEINGSTLYVAGAPRSKMGYGQVLIFEPATQEMLPLNIRAQLQGPQLGSYFGATLCSVDLNNDGRSDLLVGAPNYVWRNGGLPFDQGAVFVYLADKKGDSLTMVESGYLSGSEQSGARFGSSIANLGDVDGDGLKDIAIGAPWENEGTGVVYIYRGSAKGLHSKYVQRIIADTARGFGMSISKALDVDGNNCNDLAIGAHKSDTAYLFRCVPTMEVHAAIKVPDAMNLPQNATNFTAVFCVTVPAKKKWPHVQIELKAKITIDSEVHSNRARLSGDSEYTLVAKPGNDICDEQIVEVKRMADLSEPISMKFELTPIPLSDDTSFNDKAARLSESSTLSSSFLIQLIRDCGDDLICTPWLVMTLDALNYHYIPGRQEPLGIVISVLNKEEPAYGAKVRLSLPLPPKRIPSACTLDKNITKDGHDLALNMTCIVPAPLSRGESVNWMIELEYTLKVVEFTELKVEARLEDPLFNRNITKEPIKEVIVGVQPLAEFRVSGKPLPNTTITVTRDKFDKAELVPFVHFFEITNFGPSDWAILNVTIEIPVNATLSSPTFGCKESDKLLNCTWSIAANVSLPVEVQLKFDLEKNGQFFDAVSRLNATTTMTLHLKDSLKVMSSNITTTFILEPSSSIWPYIVGSIAGFLVLTVIVYVLYKYGFFSRTSRDHLKRLQETSTEEPSSSRPPSIDGDESTFQLLESDNET